MIQVIARQENGTEFDVTEGVQALYDHMIHSLDWGSGFLTIEDATGVIKLAQACGFLVPDDAAAAFESYARELARPLYGGNPAWRSNVLCARCGESVLWTYKKGWHHPDHNPGHVPQLWR